ncbi:SMI1/KNR4 family protein [Streptomyces sp. NPDC032161]|uniref:SMI1/KNR4 family protein n=1 Tax=unclassified Streptomyces TaxID=2593676 RepID=UPI0033EFBE71
MTSEALTSTLAMLGRPSARYEAGGWRELESELGFELPCDYKTIIDAYAPVCLNEHIYLHHPSAPRWNLRNWIRETVVAWSEVDWDVEISGDPRSVLGLAEMSFGTRHGLTPLLGTDRGETVFLAQDRDGASRILVENGEEEFFGPFVTFADWLHGYLTGMDVVGPGSGIFYPGPVKFTSLPMTAEDAEDVWYGPDRGM